MGAVRSAAGLTGTRSSEMTMARQRFGVSVKSYAYGAE